MRGGARPGVGGLRPRQAPRRGLAVRGAERRRGPRRRRWRTLLLEVSDDRAAVVARSRRRERRVGSVGPAQRGDASLGEPGGGVGVGQAGDKVDLARRRDAPAQSRRLGVERLSNRLEPCGAHSKRAEAGQPLAARCGTPTPPQPRYGGVGRRVGKAAHSSAASSTIAAPATPGRPPTDVLTVTSSEPSSPRTRMP